MNACKLLLLGGFTFVLENGAAVVIPSKKIRLLLAYLILSNELPQSRNKIAFDLWPDSTEKQALTNLRKLIHNLKENTPQIERFLTITSTALQWNHDLPCYSDVREFEVLAQSQTLLELQNAEKLYRGELLPGFYEEWLDAKRELLAEQYSTVLKKMITILESKREYSTAILYAHKLLAQDPLSEKTYRTLMRLSALNKNRAGIAQTYQQLSNILHRDLGVNPAKDTQQLYERLMQNGREELIIVQSRPPFFGRTDEWSRMLGVWQQIEEGNSTMLVIKGKAGSGKTRLAVELKDWAEQQGFQTAFSSCYPSTRSLAYTSITAWLKSIPIPDVCMKCLTEISRLLPDLMERYPDIAEPLPIKDRWQLHKWYEAIKLTLLAGGPLLLILDDLQWCDQESLEIISFLLHGNAQLLIIATLRTDEQISEVVEHFYAALQMEQLLTEIDLEPLKQEEVSVRNI